MGQFAAVAAHFHAAEGEARVGVDDAVDEDGSGLQQVCGDVFGALCISRKDGGTEAVARQVGEADGVGSVGGFDDGGDGSEEFFVEGGASRPDVGEDGGREVSARAVGDKATGEALCPGGDASLLLVVELVAQVVAGHGAVGVGGVTGWSVGGGVHFHDKTMQELIVHVAVHDGPFGADA